jgi:hypothetical protein
METKEAKEVAQIQHEIWDQFFDLEISRQQNVQVTVTLHKRSWDEEDIQTLIKEIKNLKIRTPYQRTLGGESAIIEVKESPLQSNAPLGAALGGLGLPSLKRLILATHIPYGLEAMDLLS